MAPVHGMRGARSRQWFDAGSPAWSVAGVEQPIIGFHQDEQGDWVADLACGHGQHVRHQPPFINRPWVLTSTGREAQRGTLLKCKKCDEGT
jgi:hypothetical protein